MPLVRTTIEPWREISVSDAEYVRLLRDGLIYTGAPPAAPPAFSTQQYAEMLTPGSPIVTAARAGIGAGIVAVGAAPAAEARLWIETGAGGDPDAIRLYFEDGT